MLEMKIAIDAPELAAALEKLAAAIDPTGRAAASAPSVPVVPVAAATLPVSTVPVATVAPAPAVPVAAAPSYTLDMISRAGAALVDAGKMQELMALLERYGVAAVTQISPGQYGTFATELRALGAQI